MKKLSHNIVGNQIVLVLILALLLLGLLLNGGITIAQPLVATAVSLLLVFGAPGYLLVDLLWGRRTAPTGLEKLSYAFSLGMMGLLVSATLLLAWHGSLTGLANLWLALTAGLAIGWLARGVQQRYAFPGRISWGQGHPVSREYLGLLLAMGLGLALILYFFATTPVIAGIWGDRWNYLPYIQKYLQLNRLDPTGTLEVHTDTRFARTGWLGVLALLSQTSGVHPVELYGIYLPPFMALLSLLNFWVLAGTLFPNKKLALLATLVQIIYLASSMTGDLGGGGPGIGLTAYMRNTDDKFFALLVLYPVAITWMLKYLQKGTGKYLALWGLALLALAVTHPISFATAGFSVGSLALIHLISSPRAVISAGHWLWQKVRKQGNRAGWRILLHSNSLMMRAAWLIILVGVTSLIPLEARQVVQQGTQVFSDEAMAAGTFLSNVLQNGERHILYQAPDFYMAAYTLVARPMIILALLVTPLLVFNLKQNLSAKFLFSNTVVPLLLIYNPWTAPMLGAILSPVQLRRILFMIPVALTISFVAYQGLTWLRQRAGQAARAWLNFAPLAFVLLLMLWLQTPLRQSISYVQEQHKLYSISADELDILKQLGTIAPVDSLALAQPHINLHLPSFVVGVKNFSFRSHFTEPVVGEYAEKFYQTRLINNFVMEFLNTYRVRYIIIETSAPLTPQLKQMPEFFTVRRDNSTYTLFEITSAPEQTSVIRANSFLQIGRLNEAEQVYKESESSALTHYGLGQTYLRQGDTPAAIESFQEAVRLKPDWVEAQLDLANAYLIQEKQATNETYLPQAAEIYQQLLTSAPDHPAVQAALFRNYREFTSQDFISQLIHYSQTAISQQPDDITRYQMLARAYQANNQPERVVETYRLALDHWPNWAEAHQSLGQTYAEQNQTTAAIQTYQEAITLSPTWTRPYIQLAHIYQKSKQIDQTVELYQTAARHNPNAAWPHVELGQMYLKAAE